MVSGDVFRAPSSPLSLCVQIGSGVQILASGFITLLFAALGFLSPASRGSLVTAALVMYLLLSVAAGYAAVWLWGLVNRSYEGWFKVGHARTGAQEFKGRSNDKARQLCMLDHHPALRE